MKRILLALVLIVLMTVTSFAQSISIDDAREVASPYVYQGEALEMKPQTLAYSATKSYWVFEITSLGQIAVMVPVDADDGAIDHGADVEPVLKTHYLANFFATDSSIAEFLGSTLSFAQRKQDSYSNALSELETYEVQIPENVTLTKLSPLKSSLEQGASRAEALRSRVLDAQLVMGSILRESDITNVESKFSAVFSAERSLLDKADDIIEDSNDFKTDIASSGLTGENAPLAQALVGVINTYRLTESIIVEEDALTQNENTINSFFATLDSKGHDYLLKLQNRINESSASAKVRENLERIYGYSANYTSLMQSAASIPEDYLVSSGFVSDATSLGSLINETLGYCTSTRPEDCSQADTKFSSMATLVAALQSDIDSYNPITCSGGKVLVSGVCRCPSGTEEQGGQCVAPQGGGFNMMLIGGLIVLIIAVIIFGKLMKKGGEGEEVKETGYWGADKF
jgi:hypothetical protein